MSLYIRLNKNERLAGSFTWNLNTTELAHFYFIFLSAGIFGFLLAIVLLLSFGGKNHLANIMLSLAFIAVIWYAFMCLLIFSGEIIHYPKLYNKGNPFYYLFAPCCYLYIRLLVSPEKGFKRKDWLHFLPVLLALIDIMPYVFKTTAEKQHIVNLVAQDPSWNYRLVYAFVPQKIHYLIRSVLMFFYLILQWKYLFSARKNNSLDKKLRYWLYSFSMLVTVLRLFLITMMIKGVAMHASQAISSGFFPLIISIGIFVLSIGLFFWPRLLYGIQSDQLIENSIFPPMPPVNEKHKEVALTAEMICNMAKMLEDKLQETELYREQKLTISKLAIQLNISPRNLSVLLNHHYKLRFTDFINNYRIGYIKKRIEDGNWRTITIDALADEAGFSSRSAFYLVFKKNTGLSPVEYISKVTIE